MSQAEPVSVSALEPLTCDEALQRLQLVGPNTLPQSGAMPLWRRIVHAIRDPLVLVLVLLGAVALTMATGDGADTIVISLVIVVNTTLADRPEISADHAVSALGALVAPVARVLRDGRQVSRPVAELVPGDLVVLAEGIWSLPTRCSSEVPLCRSTSLPLPGSRWPWTSRPSLTPAQRPHHQQGHTVGPLRSLLSTHEVPPVVWGLALLTAVAAYGCTRWLRPRTL